MTIPGAPTGQPSDHPQDPPDSPDRGVVEVGLVVAAQPVVDHLQVLSVGWPQVQAGDGRHAQLQCPHHWVSCVLQPGTVGKLNLSPSLTSFGRKWGHPTSAPQ